MIGAFWIGAAASPTPPDYPDIPEGYVLWVDDDGAYFLDADYYYLGETE